MPSLAERKQKLIQTIEQLNDELAMSAVESAVAEILNDESALNAELFARIDQLPHASMQTWEEVKTAIRTKKRGT